MIYVKTVNPNHINIVIQMIIGSCLCHIQILLNMLLEFLCMIQSVITATRQFV
ncbi:hypothetical protein RhiirA4_409554, partial [Rhizophagus irregularis]